MSGKPLKATAANHPRIVAMPGEMSIPDAHRSGFGASEAAAVVGHDPYCSPWELYHRKIGALPEKDDSESMHLRRGKALEPWIVKEFKIQTGQEVMQYPCPTYRHPTIDHMLATPDGILTAAIGLECKSIGWRMADEIGEPGSNQLPKTWLLQCQQQMAVLGFDRVIVAVMVEVERLQTYTVHRHEAIIDVLKTAEAELWQRIQDRNPPPPEDSAGLEAVKRVYRNVELGKVILLTDEAKQRWARKAELDEQIKALEWERDKLKAEVFHEMEDCHLAVLGDGKCIRRQLVEGTTYEVTRKPRIDYREIKIPKGLSLPIDAGKMLPGAVAND